VTITVVRWLVDLVSIVFAGFGLVIAGVSVRNIWQTWVIYRGAATRRLRELPSGSVRISPTIEVQAAELEALGYAPLAVFGADLPGQQNPVIDRVLVSDDRTVQVDVVAARQKPMVALLSRFADGFVVETHYPERVRLVRDAIELGGTRESLRAAIDLHATRSQAATALHGPPDRFESVADVLAFDAEYRERLSSVVLLARTRRAIAALVVNMAVGLLLAAWALSDLLQR
jgi:hypothetical protein